MDNNEILFKPNGLILASANKTITSSEFKLYDTLLQRCQITKDLNWRTAKLSREEIKSKTMKKIRFVCFIGILQRYSRCRIL